jgi:hypothetical protein
MMRRLAIGFLLLLTGQGPVAEPTPGGVPTIVITPDNDERIEKFKRRGFNDLQKFRDISAARLWLEVAANHDSMRAARALSDTYNPIWLIEQHVIGWEGLSNPELAFIWARRAYELGDRTKGNLFAEAPKQ